MVRHGLWITAARSRRARRGRRRSRTADSRVTTSRTSRPSSLTSSTQVCSESVAAQQPGEHRARDGEVVGLERGAAGDRADAPGRALVVLVVGMQRGRRGRAGTRWGTAGPARTGRGRTCCPHRSNPARATVDGPSDSRRAGPAGCPQPADLIRGMPYPYDHAGARTPAESGHAGATTSGTADLGGVREGDRGAAPAGPRAPRPQPGADRPPRRDRVVHLPEVREGGVAPRDAAQPPALHAARALPGPRGAAGGPGAGRGARRRTSGEAP